MKQKIQLLGIVNLTDDSYYAPSRARSCEAFMDRVRQMVAEGADIIDIGACSTRPGSQPVGAEEEWRRLEPALKAFRNEFPEYALQKETVRDGRAVIYTFQKNGKTITVISRVPVDKFELIHNCWIENLEVVNLA